VSVRVRWLILAAATLAPAAVTAGRASSSHCASYPTGRHCSTLGYGLIATSIACAALALVVVAWMIVRGLQRVAQRRATRASG
jgi:hypothetical protein